VNIALLSCISQAEEIMKLKLQINRLYVKHTGQTLELITNSMERDRFMSPVEAKEFGIIDKVLDHPPSPSSGAAATPADTPTPGQEGAEKK